MLPFFLKCLLSVILLVAWQIRSAELEPLAQSLPEPVTNNAVALITTNNQVQLFSFMGLSAKKNWQGVHSKAFQVTIGSNNPPIALPNVPSSLPLSGRLASVATTVNNRIFLFGGYTVAQDHSEISSPDNFEFIPGKQQYRALAATPVPTDDAIVLPYKNRYIYQISGWHNDGNVNLVQVYDIKTNTWAQASPFLGQPVFGHAGGIIGNQMLVCDGVSVVAQVAVRRTFHRVQACYSGVINREDPYKIDWRKVAHPTGQGRYRMAAAGVTLATKNGKQSGVLFAGGSANPYNYNGIGYNGEPSEPSDQVWFYDFSTQIWSSAALLRRTMDHRGLLVDEQNQLAYILGGMAEQQTIVNAIQSINLNTLKLRPITSAK